MIIKTVIIKQDSLKKLTLLPVSTEVLHALGIQLLGFTVQDCDKLI